MGNGPDQQQTPPPPPDVMTWLPRREDYEQPQMILPDETLAEKIARLINSIETAQTTIKEVVDGDSASLEEKMFGTMDVKEDLEELGKLLKDCDSDPEAKSFADDMKRAKVGLINLKAYLSQVDCLEFATALMNLHLFKVGSAERFGPWLSEAEARVNDKAERPGSYEEAIAFEERACLFLKEAVKGNRMMKQVKEAAENIKGDVEVQEDLATLSERYYVLCKKAEARMKNLQTLLTEWKRLDDILAPTEPNKMDDFQVKQFIIFLRTYKTLFA